MVLCGGPATFSARCLLTSLALFMDGPLLNVEGASFGLTRPRKSLGLVIAPSRRFGEDPILTYFFGHFPLGGLVEAA